MSSSKVDIQYGSLEDIELPETIYKYRTWSDKWHKRFIANREVFLASPETFEDKMDCNNPTRFDLLTKNEIYDYFIWSSKKQNPEYTRQQHRKFARKWTKESAVNDKKHVARFMEQSIRDYYDHEGILSLTENWNNDEMWKKYAEDGKGFCIGYNTKEMFKHLGGGGPVEYVEDLPRIFPEPFMEFAEAIRNRVYYKTKKWEFEDEYRTMKFWPNPASNNDRQIKLPKNVFKKIVIGNNMSDQDKKELIECVEQNIGSIEIIELQNAT